MMNPMQHQRPAILFPESTQSVSVLFLLNIYPGSELPTKDIIYELSKEKSQMGDSDCHFQEHSGC